MLRYLPILALLALAACEELQKAGMTEQERSSAARAERLEKNGNLAGAAAIYRQMMAESDVSNETYGKLAGIYRKLGRPDDAVLLLQEARIRTPGDTKLLSQLGYALIDAGKLENAVDVFDELTAIEPGNAMFYNGKAVAFDTAGNHFAAQELYQTALALAPDSLAIQNNLALSYILNGQVDEAITLLEPLVEKKKANATMRQNLALAYGLKGNKNQALDISRQDLRPEQAQDNLRFYEQYKRLSKQKAKSEN